jgi:hypothetical protein
MSTRRVRVISESGRVVGIFAPYPQDTYPKPGTPDAQLRAGPGQQEHEVEVEWPTDEKPAALSDALHARVRKALQLK